MIEIKHYPFIRHMRCDAATYVLRYRNGALARAGRGLAFWFLPDNASISAVPMDDRELPFVINARSEDFQDVMIQGAILWRVVDPEALAARIDFTIGLNTGEHLGEPVEQIRSYVASLAQQLAVDHVARMTVAQALDAGVAGAQARLEEGLLAASEIQALGIEVAGVRVAKIAPDAELARALQTPTYEKLQQQADEATFERRALAVEKERAIAENELNTQIELAARKRELIDREAENTRRRAEAEAAAEEIRADSEAGYIRAVETAKVEAERARVDVYDGLPPQMMLGLAAQEFATKLERIDNLTIAPDMLADLVGRAMEKPAR